MNDYPHTIWIKEGSWRLLSQYDTAEEARRVVRRLKADGEDVRYVLRGGAADLSLRANVHQE